MHCYIEIDMHGNDEGLLFILRNSVKLENKVLFFLTAYAPRGAYPSGYRANITTYERKKLPRFLLPFPFGLYTKDPIRPFPSNSIFTSK